MAIHVAATLLRKIVCLAKGSIQVYSMHGMQDVASLIVSAKYHLTNGT